MTKQKMEEIVANLLLKQRRFRRLGTDLPPNELLLLSRLLQRLGYTKMSRIKPKRYGNNTPTKVGFNQQRVGLNKPQDNIPSLPQRPRQPRIDEDLRLFRKHIRSLHATSARGVLPNSSQERLLLHKFITNRGLIVKKSPYTYYDSDTHTLYHPNPEQHQQVSDAYIRQGGGNIKFSKIKRYAKFNLATHAHPLVQGFPIEFALRHVANSPHSTDDAKNLAVAALKGHTEALWGLHDELQNSNHPILNAGYKWLNAADKLHLDKHTYTALEERAAEHRAQNPHTEHRIHRDTYIWQFTPEAQARHAAVGITTSPNSIQGQTHQAIMDRVRELSPRSSDEDINESIRRHGYRAEMEMRRRLTGTSPDQSEGHAIRNLSEIPKIDANSTKNLIATRYKRNLIKYSLANKSNFIGALLKVSSPEHKLFVQRTKELARRVGAQKTKEFPALHDTPQQSVPGVAMAVYGNIQPNSAHALGSWVNGLLPNSPGYVVFHARPGGPDTLYRIRMEGSGYDTRAKLDRAGIYSRIFVPHHKGLDILIPDKGNKLGQSVQQFAIEQKVPLEASQGHTISVGSQDQGQARDTFRNNIVKAEQMKRHPKKYGAPPQDKPPHPVSLKGIKGLKGSKTISLTNAIRSLSPNSNVGLPTRSVPYPIANRTIPATPSIPPIPTTTDNPDDVHSIKPNIVGRSKQNLGSHISTKPIEKEEDPLYYDVVKPPQSYSINVTQPPLISKQITTNPTFSNKEYSNLLYWAGKHAERHTDRFDKWLKNPNLHKSEVTNLLVKHIIDAAHEMRKNNTNTHTIDLGGGKRLKVNIPNRKSWNNYVPNKPNALNKLTRRRLMYRGSNAYHK